MAAGGELRRTGNPARLAGELAHLLVEARGDRTRQEIAEAAGVRPNTLGELEKGRANPTLRYLDALGSVYGVRFGLVVIPGAAEAMKAASEAERNAAARAAVDEGYRR